MKRFLVVTFLLVSLLAPISQGSSSVLAQTVGGACADSEEAAFLQLINAYRAASGIGPVALSQSLNVAANTLSMDMATNNFFGHISTDGSNFVDRFSAAGYPNPTRGGEITYAGAASGSEALAGWQASPAHNTAMLDPNYAAVGIARAYNPDTEWGWYWTAAFGPTIDGAGCYGEAETVVQAAAALVEIPVSEEPAATLSDPVAVATIEPTAPAEPTPTATEPTVPVEPTPTATEPTVPVELTPIATEPVEPTPVVDAPTEPVEPTAVIEVPTEPGEPIESTEPLEEAV